MHEELLQPGRPADLYGVLWCPVPPLGPLPEETTLEWEEATGTLRLGSINMVATLERITKVSLYVCVTC